MSGGATRAFLARDWRKPGACQQGTPVPVRSIQWFFGPSFNAALLDESIYHKAAVAAPGPTRRTSSNLRY